MCGTREKLIELLKSAYGTSFNAPYFREHELEPLADHLIANGVTVQQWIPVSERLPEKDTYTLVTTDGVVISAYWHNDRFYGFSAKGIATVGGVTHWMPLPEPPKGE